MISPELEHLLLTLKLKFVRGVDELSGLVDWWTFWSTDGSTAG